jgi:DNA-binding NarL/FixJ family response regulator
VADPAARESEHERILSDFHAVVVTSRAIVRAFFTDMVHRHGGSVDVTFLALASQAVAGASPALAAASVAVVDASVDPVEAVAVSQAIGAERPRLPITAVFCCPHSATAADLRGLLSAGVGGLLDLQLSAEDTLRVLRGVARGQGAFHLQLAAGSNTSLSKLFAGERETDQLSDHDLGLLRLVALGLTDHEIGRQLYISHHTVKHRIDRLRQRVNARNRVQLAAWAGGQDALRTAHDEASGRAASATGQASVLMRATPE